MTTKVLSIEAEKTVAECVKIMRDARVGCVVVVDGGNPVGIFTERDLVREIADFGAFSVNRPMEKVMTRPVTTILPSASVWDAISLMGRLGIRRLPVLEGGKLVGIVTERDIFRLILSQQNLLLESISESMPAATREQLRELLSRFGPERVP